MPRNRTPRPVRESKHLHAVATVQQDAILGMHAVLSLLEHDRVGSFHNLIIALNSTLCW